MAADGSAYAALGLEPGADASAIEQAYKRLIKEHHPDREGGDVDRAAEINRAYRELRATTRLKDPLELYDHEAERRSRLHWLALALILAAAAAAALLIQGPIAPISVERLSRHHPPPVHVTDMMDRQLDLGSIDAAVRSAWDIHRTRDEMALSATSKQCNERLRTAPQLGQLDRCVAFDDAVILLEDRDPLRDRGPFSELAVMGRQWSAASALSDDYVAIDGRLDRIRLRVEELLAPLINAAPAAPGARGGNSG